jgi:hypothetical protein
VPHPLLRESASKAAALTIGEGCLEAQRAGKSLVKARETRGMSCANIFILLAANRKHAAYRSVDNVKRKKTKQTKQTKQRKQTK